MYLDPRAGHAASRFLVNFLIAIAAKDLTAVSTANFKRSGTGKKLKMVEKKMSIDGR
jgi:hypothetical protein